MLERSTFEDIENPEDRYIALWTTHILKSALRSRPRLPEGTDPLADLVCKNCGQEQPHIYSGEQEVNVKGDTEPLYACLNCFGTRVLE